MKTRAAQVGFKPTTYGLWGRRFIHWANEATQLAGQIKATQGKANQSNLTW